VAWSTALAAAMSIQGIAVAETAATPRFENYQSDSPANAKRLEDYQKILTVLKQYIVAIDTLDENLYSSAFAEKDAVLSIREVTRHGREEIKLEITGDKDARTAREAKAAASGDPTPVPVTTFHMMSNSHIVFVDPNHARHNAYYQVYTRPNDHPGGVVRLTTPITLVAIGRYDDELVKVHGKWFIQHRQITPDTSGGF
jgi:hypothetical protein